MTDSSPTSPYFEVRDLRRSFDGKEVLRGVNFQIERGKTTVILGGSGAGKSVLIKHLNGLFLPHRGSVMVEGTEINTLSEKELAPIRRRIGILFQDGALFDSLSVAENVAFPLREAGVHDRTTLRNRVTEALESVGLAGEEETLPSALSGGMRKRAALARALVAEPDALLCDEPTAGLDPILSETIARLLRETTERHHLTTVVVTHDLGAMRIMADRVIFLHLGQVHFDGTPDELTRSEEDELIRFLSASGGAG
ncbi:MAG: ATP-binding cassette domain-containing protein [Verrucomicrobiota bacterium]